MKKLFLLLFLCPFLSAQDEGPEPPDEVPPEEAPCDGCHDHFTGSWGGGANRELWRFVPGYLNKGGKCYQGCKWIGCKARGQMRFENRSGSARIITIPGGQPAGTVPHLGRSQWFPVKMNTACGQLPAPAFWAYKPDGDGPTSGWLFKCASCSRVDDDGGGSSEDEGVIRN